MRFDAQKAFMREARGEADTESYLAYYIKKIVDDEVFDVLRN